MYSLNLPVPGRVAALANGLHPELADFDTVRERHTLVVKRLGQEDPVGLEKRVRRVLPGTPAFEVRVDGIDVFEEPAAGRGPVIYLAVESPGLVELHRRLCQTFDPVPGLEGDDYVPHVTIARGGSTEALDRLLDVEVDMEPVTWTANELVFWDARREETVGRIGLPA